MDTNLSSAISGPAVKPSEAVRQHRPAAMRLLFVDNVRWVMIMLVLSMHAAVTYSGIGSWYYNEPARLSVAEKAVFVTYQAFLQSFFMGLLFFVAGYFVPGAYDRKGWLRFLRDRAYRLGLPSVLYIVALQPLTVKLAYGHWGRIWIGGTGPLWFCVALLIFCVGYALFRRIAGQPRQNEGRSFPGKGVVAAFILALAAATFFVRIPWPNGTSFYNMQFCYFPQYILFFIIGTLAYRYGWLTSIPRSVGMRWGRIGLFGGLVVWSLVVILGSVLGGRTSDFGGGWTGQSAGLCLWESLAGVGISIGCITLFRERWFGQGRWAKFFSANAFAVYVFHPPILVAITMGMAGLHLPPLLKFVMAASFGMIASFAICALVVRRIPLLKKIV